MKSEQIDLHNSIPSAFFAIQERLPDETVYLQPVGTGSERHWMERRYSEVACRVVRITKYLEGFGRGRGRMIAILSGTRPEWVESDLGILSTGGTTVSIYPSLPAHDVGYILHDSGAEIVFAENKEQVEKLIDLMEHPFSIPARENMPAEEVKLRLQKIIAFEEVAPHPLVVQLKDVVGGPLTIESIPDSVSSIRRDYIASIVYTSGTTGPPKGVVQTHGNHLSNVSQAMDCGMFALDGDLFLYLPLAHSFARLISYLGFLTPSKLKFCGVADRKSSKVDLQSVAKDMAEGSAAVVPSVPRVFEKMKQALEGKALHSSLSGKILSSTIRSSLEVFRAKKEGRSPKFLSNLIFSATDVIRLKIRTRLFGPKFSHAISGGAKLTTEVNEFFWALGIEIYEGYGLTETCVATNVNRKGMNRIGTVGPALKWVETRIAEDGEILFRGPNIALGYHNRPQATAESWDKEGWFHTGDIGHLDADGFLAITDRKKDLIVTAGGKKIPPQKIEGLLAQSSFISQSIVYGDDKPYCVALITLNSPVVVSWLDKNGGGGKENLARNPKVIEEIGREIKRINQDLPSFEAIKKFKILDEDFTVENGLLTPTLKVKRKAAIVAFKAEIEGLYSGQ